MMILSVLQMGKLRHGEVFFFFFLFCFLKITFPKVTQLINGRVGF